MKKFDVTAFGEILIDFTPCGSAPGGAALFAQNPGGAPANVAVALSRLGGTAAFTGKVGDDMHGSLLKRTLQKEGIDVSGMKIDPDTFTTLAFVSVNEAGERDFSFARKPGADTRMTAEEMPVDLIKNSSIFHIGSLSMTHEPSRSATLKGIETARENDVLVSYDPNYRASLWPSEKEAVLQMRSLVPLADIMKISDEETALLTDFTDPKRALQELLNNGVSLAVVTLGPDGAMAMNQNGSVQVNGFPSTVADTNGAGDSFWGAMLYQIAHSECRPENLSVEQMQRFLRNANAVAALTVRKSGAIPAMPTASEVSEFLLEQDKYE